MKYVISHGHLPHIMYVIINGYTSLMFMMSDGSVEESDHSMVKFKDLPPSVQSAVKKEFEASFEVSPQQYSRWLQNRSDITIDIVK